MTKKTLYDDLDPLDPLSGFEDDVDPLSSYIEDDDDPLSSYIEDVDLSARPFDNF